MECHKKMKKFTYKRIVLICGILFLLSYVFLQIANAGELDDVKKAIKDKGAKWTAGDTSVSNLPDNEKKLRAGAIISGEGAKGAKALATATVPSSWDWRAYNGSALPKGNYVTPIKDQGSCGSCWAFGSIAQLESVEEIYNKTPYSKKSTIDLSEQYLVSCVNCTPCPPTVPNCGGCNGCYVTSAYDFLVSKGTTNENSYRYCACDSSCPTKNITITAKLSQWALVAQDIDQLKAAVYLHPITVGFYVYNDFFSYKSGVYEHITTGDTLVGGHVVCIVGWDDTAPYSNGYGCFIVKNSWGTGWGESGYFRIAYSQVTDPLVLFGRVAGNFALAGALPAPPITANLEKVVTLWGNIKSTY